MVENTKNVHIPESFLQILLEFGILLNWKTNENFIEIALFSLLFTREVNKW